MAKGSYVTCHTTCPACKRGWLGTWERVNKQRECIYCAHAWEVEG